MVFCLRQGRPRLSAARRGSLFALLLVAWSIRLRRRSRSSSRGVLLAVRLHRRLRVRGLRRRGCPQPLVRCTPPLGGARSAGLFRGPLLASIRGLVCLSRGRSIWCTRGCAVRVGGPTAGRAGVPWWGRTFCAGRGRAVSGSLCLDLRGQRGSAPAGCVGLRGAAVQWRLASSVPRPSRRLVPHLISAGAGLLSGLALLLGLSLVCPTMGLPHVDPSARHCRRRPSVLTSSGALRSGLCRSLHCRALLCSV